MTSLNCVCVYMRVFVSKYHNSSFQFNKDNKNLMPIKYVCNEVFIFIFFRTSLSFSLYFSFNEMPVFILFSSLRCTILQFHFEMNKNKTKNSQQENTTFYNCHTFTFMCDLPYINKISMFEYNLGVVSIFFLLFLFSSLQQMVHVIHTSID